jgi:hypothetical protein
MTDQPKPDKPPEQQDAPKADNTAKSDAPLSPKPDERPKTAPLTPVEPLNPAAQAATKVEAPGETAKGDRPATLVDTAKPAAPTDTNKPGNGLPEAPATKVEGVSTHDLNETKNAEPPKPSDGGSPSPAPAKSENSPPAGEPKVTQRIPDLESLGLSSGTPAAAAGGTICPTCGHRNRPGILVCENCGTNLMTGKQSGVGTRDLMREQEKGEGKLDSDAQNAVDSAGGTVFTEEMVLRIEIEGGSTPMLVYPKQEIIMGRRDPNTGGMPDVDLTAYAGYRMGVSRRHAAIRLQEKQLNVSDLGSSNGTFLNGTRLNAHRPYPLRDGDEVRLGQMVLRLYFQSNKDRK